MELISNAKFGQPVESGTCFDVKESNLGISIHRIHGLDGWFLNCRRLGIMDRELKSDNLFKCVRESKEIIKDKIIEIQKDVDLFCADIEVEIKR